jgi:PKD repeat protein
MKKNVFYLIGFWLITVNLNAQSCDGVPCVANPQIIQENLIECSQPALDSSQGQGTFCPEEEECLDVCENTSNTYSTAYNAGSTYIWNVTGGQIIYTSPLANAVTVVWGSGQSGSLTVYELDVNSCDNYDVLCVNIKPTPEASIQTLPNSIVFCKDVPIKFKAIDLNLSQLTQQFDSCNAYQQWWDTTQYSYSMHYLWDFGDGTNSVIPNPIHAYTTAGLKTITLVMSNNCQCSDTITMQIQITNDVGPNVISCIGALCEGDTAQYCTDAINPNWVIEGGYFYYSTSTDDCINVIWDNNDNSLINGEGMLIVSDLSTICGSGETYFSVPILATTPEISGKTTVCLNTYEVYSYECIPGVDYYWSVSGGTILGGQYTSEIKVEWNYQVVGQVTLSLNSSTLNCNLGQTSISVDVLPRITIYGSNEVCEVGVSNYSDNLWSGSLEWSVVNGLIITPASPPYVANQIQVNWNQGIGSSTVNAIATQNGIYCQQSASYNVNIIEKPQEANSISGDSIICPNATYLYTVSESNATSPQNLKYQWTITGGTPATADGESVMITWNSVGPYLISVSNHLQSSPYCSSDPITKDIDPVSVQNPIISGSSTSCLNTIATYNLTSIYPDWAVISWSVSDPDIGSVVAGQGTAQAQIEWGNQTGITDVVVAVDVCGVIYSQAFPITFLNQPISFTASSNPVCCETTVIFSSTGGLGTYNWNFGDGTSSSQSNPNKSYDEPGNYLVHLTFTDAANQCVSTYSSVIDVQGIAGKLLPEGNSLFCISSSISQPLYIASTTNATPLVEWFQNGNSVSTSSTYTVVSSPPSQSGIGSYDVVLTDVNGCSNTLNTINISTVNCSGGGGGGWCGGGSGCPALVPLTPYGTNCNQGIGTTTFDFTSPNGNVLDWRVDNGPIYSTTSQSFTFNEAGVYKVKALYSGCLFGTEQITVPLVVDVNYSTICNPSNSNQITYYFTDHSSYLLGYGSANYLWDFGDGNTSVLQNPNHVYLANGNYNVTLTVTYGAYSCSKTITVSVDDFNVNYSYLGSECENIPTITFTSVSSPTQIVSWIWDFGDGASSAREIPQRTYNSASTYLTSLQVTDVSGCIASSSGTVIIEPTPTINSLSNFGPLCSNDASINLSTIINYNIINNEVAVWSGVGVEQDPTTLVYYFNPLLAGGGTHELCVTVTDDNLCYVSECIMIEVICPEKPKIFGESEFCYDNWAYHNYTTQNGYTNYLWYENGSPTTNTWSSYGFYNSSTTDLTVEFTDDNGCTSMSETFTVKVNPKPNYFYASSSGALCPEQAITLSHNGTESNVDYFWNTPEKHSTSTINITAESNYDYYVVASNQYGCITKSNYISMHQAPNMCAVLAGCYCDSTILDPSNLINISGVSNSWLYNTEWLRNGIPQINSNNLQLDPTDPNYTNIVPATFNLKVTDSYGCVYYSDDLNLETNCMVCYEESFTEYNDTICDGDTYVLGNNFYTTGGTHTSYLTGIKGCDSIVELNLYIKPVYTTQNPQNICDGEYYIIGSSNYNTSGVYSDILIAQNGCDSSVTTNLTVEPLLNGTYNIDICFGDSLLVGGNIYYTTGVYFDTLPNLNTCDSLIESNLNVFSYSFSNNNPTICAGQYFEVGQSTYYNTGIYTDVLQNINGCDSVVTTEILVNPTYENQQYINLCEGDSLQVGQNFYNTSGTYVDSFNTINYCDSVIYTNLFVENPTTIIIANPPLLELTITNGLLPYSYEVGNQNGIIMTSTNNSTPTAYITPIENGMYYFIVIDGLGCVADTVYYDVNFVNTNIQEIDITNLKIFPNPSKDIFNITFTSKTIQDLKVRVLNVIGEEIISIELEQFIGEYTEQLNLKENAKGIYFLEIETNDGIVNKKLILQ